MNRNFQNTGIALVITALLFSCGNKKETPESIAARWCELNAKASKAPNGPEKEKAVSERTEFEKSMETKYKNDTATMQAIFRAVEACEAASEGRNEKLSAGTGTPDAESLLPLANADAVSAAEAYCSLVDQSILATQNGGAGLNKIVSAKVIFEKNMDESYRNNPERRDSIFKLIEPCMAREVKLRSK